MRLKVALVLTILMAAGSAHAGLSVGPYVGMSIPVVNDEAKVGPLFGAQVKLGLFSWLGVGAYGQGSKLGDASQTFFAKPPLDPGITMSIDGGSVISYGATVFLGKTNSETGLNVFLLGSAGQFIWSRENRDDINKLAYQGGIGMEVVIPNGIGIEGRALLEAIPTDNDGSIKSFNWWIGANYHFGAR